MFLSFLFSTGEKFIPVDLDLADRVFGRDDPDPTPDPVGLWIRLDDDAGMEDDLNPAPCALLLCIPFLLDVERPIPIPKPPPAAFA